MSRLLLLLLMTCLMACGNKQNETTDRFLTQFAAERHDPIVDQQIQPLLNQYFAVLNHLQEQDSTDLELYGVNMIQLSDSLTQLNLSLDTATQERAMQGLINIQYEMTAILMESNPAERIKGAQMLSLHWIEFLATIGYQQQTIYIFSDSDENHWMGLKNKSTNPFNKADASIYAPMQILQELK